MTCEYGVSRLITPFTAYCGEDRRRLCMVYVWSPNESAYRGAYTPCVCGVRLLSAWIRIGLSRNPSVCSTLPMPTSL